MAAPGCEEFDERWLAGFEDDIWEVSLAFEKLCLVMVEPTIEVVWLKVEDRRCCCCAHHCQSGGEDL